MDVFFPYTPVPTQLPSAITHHAQMREDTENQYKQKLTDNSACPRAGPCDVRHLSYGGAVHQYSIIRNNSFTEREKDEDCLSVFVLHRRCVLVAIETRVL